MKCPHCGKMHPDDFKVCPYTAKPIEVQYQYCNNEDCDFRNPLPLSAVFCPNCGTKIERVSKDYHFDNIGDFSDGAAVVIKNNKRGIISSSGKILLECLYEDVLPFSEGLAAYKDLDGSWRFIDTEGRIVLTLDPAYYVSSLCGFKCGLCAVFKTNEDNYEMKYGYLNKQGREVIECKFSYAGDFDELSELAVVSIDDFQCAINRFGIVVSPHYDSLIIQNGWLIVHNYPQTNFIQDKSIESTINLPKKAGKYISISISNNVCAYFTDKQLGCFDMKHPNKRQTFKGAVKTIYSGFSAGLLAVQLDEGPWGFINSKCEITIPFLYSSARDFSGGLAAVKSSQNNMWGYINPNGEIVIDFKYDEARDFHNGVASVSVGSNKYVINMKGEIVLK